MKVLATFDCAEGRSFCEVRAAAEDATVAEVEIYDEIGFWGTSAAAFARLIRGLEVDEIRVSLNSPGGDAFDGLAIMNALRKHSATVVVEVDALAASAASVIAMAGDEIVMNRGAQFMIHETSAGTWGSAAEQRKLADALDKISNSYADAYAARAGGTRDEWRERMIAETWYAAEEAVEAGLATSWVDAKPKALAVAFDLSKFRYQGRAAAPAPVLGVGVSAQRGSAVDAKEGAVTYEELREALADRLEVDAAEVTDEELLEVLDSALDSDGSEDEGDDGEGAGEGGEASASLGAVPEGMALIDEATLAELRSGAARAAELEASAAAARREAVFADAVRTGRVAPAAKATWMAQLEKDEEGASALLASLIPDTIPVSEIGTADAEASAEDALYAKWVGKSEEGAE